MDGKVKIKMDWKDHMIVTESVGAKGIIISKRFMEGDEMVIEITCEAKSARAKRIFKRIE